MTEALRIGKKIVWASLATRPAHRATCPADLLELGEQISDHAKNDPGTRPNASLPELSREFRDAPERVPTGASKTE
jgi:hypothetical protein